MRILTTLFCLSALWSTSDALAQPNPSTTGSTVSPSEATAALRFHNNARSEVNVAPLEWSAELSSYAQAWADHLAAKGCKPEHRPYEGDWKQLYGENIFWGQGVPYVAQDAAKSWYEEKAKYTYGPVTDANWFATGHYTQMVWRNSKQLGMGSSRCADGTIIIVANYNPSGNVSGEKPY